MNNVFKPLIEYFSQRPRLLFRWDAIGALVTVLMLFFVLRRYEDYFGMPSHVIELLAFIGSLFTIYSCMCSLFITTFWVVPLHIIALANGIYCILTAYFLLVHAKAMTPLGLAYFIGEMAIILILAFIEWRVAKRLHLNLG